MVRRREGVLDTVNTKYHAGQKSARKQDGSLKVRSSPAVVKVEGEIAIHIAHRHVESKKNVKNHATVLRRNHAEEGEQHADDNHAQHLNSTAEQHAEEEQTSLRRSEAISVHHLPPAVLQIELFVFVGRKLGVTRASITHSIVASEVLEHGANHDEGHHSAEEENHEKRVEDAEPVDASRVLDELAVAVAIEAIVPGDIGRHPLDRVAVDHVDLLQLRKVP